MTATPLACLLAAALCGVDVSVQPLTGKESSGALQTLSTNRVTITTTQGAVTFSPQDLQQVQFPRVSTTGERAAWAEITLVDGSRVLAADYQTVGKQVVWELLTGGTVNCAASAIRSVRFRKKGDIDLADAWGEIARAKHAGDLLVVRKKADAPAAGAPAAEGGELSLDQLEGTVIEAAPARVQFDFDGEKISVKRDKVEGIVYYRPNRQPPAVALCRVIDAHQSRWLVKTLDLEGEKLNITTTGGVSASLPLSAVEQVDFSAGNVVYLTDLEQELGEFKTGLPFPKALLPDLAELYAPRKDRPIGAAVLTIGDQTYSRGLTLHGGAKLHLRVPEGMRLLRASVGLEASLSQGGDLRLQILGDNKPLLSEPFSAAQRPGPLEIELDVSQVHRLTFVVEDAGKPGLDLGDQLNLCNARLTR